MGFEVGGDNLVFGEAAGEENFAILTQPLHPEYGAPPLITGEGDGAVFFYDFVQSSGEVVLHGGGEALFVFMEIFDQVFEKVSSVQRSEPPLSGVPDISP